jgi:hypothetical protein
MAFYCRAAIFICGRSLCPTQCPPCPCSTCMALPFSGIPSASSCFLVEVHAN